MFVTYIQGDTKAQANLQTAKVTVMPFWQCRIYFSIMYYELDDSQICTLYQGSGTCNVSIKFSRIP